MRPPHYPRADLNKASPKSLAMITGMVIQASATERSVSSRLKAEERPMPRYFFHVIDGREIIDREGLELSGLKEVRAEAIRTAGAILRDEGDKFWNGTDAAGQSVLKIRFSADNQGSAPEEDQEIKAPA